MHHLLKAWLCLGVLQLGCERKPLNIRGASAGCIKGRNRKMPASHSRNFLLTIPLQGYGVEPTLAQMWDHRIHLMHIYIWAGVNVHVAYSVSHFPTLSLACLNTALLGPGLSANSHTQCCVLTQEVSNLRWPLSLNCCKYQHMISANKYQLVPRPPFLTLNPLFAWKTYLW